MASGEMSWVGKKIHLYNVTMGLYMLDCHLKPRIFQGANHGLSIGMSSS